jgi:hypothetical protein
MGQNQGRLTGGFPSRTAVAQRATLRPRFSNIGFSNGHRQKMVAIDGHREPGRAIACAPAYSEQKEATSHETCAGRRPSRSSNAQHATALIRPNTPGDKAFPV